jgi:hypothetical protein
MNLDLFLDIWEAITKVSKGEYFKDAPFHVDLPFDKLLAQPFGEKGLELFNPTTMGEAVKVSRPITSRVTFKNDFFPLLQLVKVLSLRA